MPAFNNDEIVIPEFIKLGVEPPDAYDHRHPPFYGLIAASAG